MLSQEFVKMTAKDENQNMKASEKLTLPYTLGGAYKTF